MGIPFRPVFTPRTTAVVETEEVVEADGDSVEDVQARVLF